MNGLSIFKAAVRMLTNLCNESLRLLLHSVVYMLIASEPVSTHSSCMYCAAAAAAAAAVHQTALMLSISTLYAVVPKDFSLLQSLVYIRAAVALTAATALTTAACATAQ
jgi:hypothetical protein